MSFELITRVQLIVIKHLAISLKGAELSKSIVIKILSTRATRKEENSYCCRRGARTRGAHHETSSARFERTDRSAGGSCTGCGTARYLYRCNTVYNNDIWMYNIISLSTIELSYFSRGWDRSECTTRMYLMEYPVVVGTRTAEHGKWTLASS